MAVSRPNPDELPEAGGDTRTRLLDVAERLFAEGGIATTSLRQITSEAGANLAAVNYHFGTKNGLIEAVYARRIRPLNAERLRLLREVEAAAGDTPPPLEEILRAFLVPVRQVINDPELGGESFMQLMARASLETTDEIQRLVANQFVETGMAFFRVLRRTVPHLAPHEIFVRFRFMLGAMFFTYARTLDPVKIGAPKELVPKSEEEVLADLIGFLSAGFRTPSPGRGGA